MSALGHKNVRGLDIAMNDPFGVRRIQRVGNLNRQAKYNLRLDRFSRDPVLQRHPVEELHGDEGLPICSSISWIVQMLGWFSAEAACASRWNRARACESLEFRPAEISRPQNGAA